MIDELIDNLVREVEANATGYEWGISRNDKDVKKAVADIEKEYARVVEYAQNISDALYVEQQEHLETKFQLNYGLDVMRQQTEKIAELREQNLKLMNEGVNLRIKIDKLETAIRFLNIWLDRKPSLNRKK